MKNGWRNVTDFFSESKRHYRETYMEIDEVYNDELEVSLFSSEVGNYEIYVNYGCMYGVISVEKERAYDLREEIKQVLEKEYCIHKEPTDEFIDDFVKKYNLYFEF